MRSSQKKKNICVYCGSMLGIDPRYSQLAQELGQRMAKHNLGLIYGGGSKGIMGAVAKATLQSGGQAIGIIPEFLSTSEVPLPNLDELIITKTMHERKQTMERLSDAFIILPGGLGTLEEFFEILTWRQLGLHNKEIILLDPWQFWHNIDLLIASIINNGFAKETSKKLYVIHQSVDSALESFI